MDIRRDLCVCLRASWAVSLEQLASMFAVLLGHRCNKQLYFTAWKQAVSPGQWRLITPVVLGAVLLLGARPAAALGPEDLASYTSKYYEIHTNLSRAEAKGYGLHMDRTFAEYTRRFSAFRKRDRRSMPLYLLRTRQDYISVMSHFDIDASSSGGMFFVAHKGSGLATWVVDRNASDAFETLQHEGFHQFAHAYIGQNLPVWVNEGLAEYFGDGLLIRGRMTLGLATEQRVKAVQSAIDDGTAIGFDELLAISGEQWHANLKSGSGRGHLQYHQSWSVAYFLIHGDKGRYRGAFEQYLRLVNGGRESEKAFRQAFRTQSTDAFHKRWERFVQGLEPDVLTTAVSRMRFLARGLRYLHENDQPTPLTIDELRRALQRVGFRLVGRSHGQETVISAMDDVVYGYSLGNGGHRWFELLEPEASRLLPRIAANGLRPAPMLTWSRGEGDKLTIEIGYR